MKSKPVNIHRESHYLRRRGLYFGTDTQDQQPLYLSPKRLGTHLHLLGPTGSGKSRLLLWLFQLLCSTNRPIVLADFKGGLYRMARDWALANGYTKRLVLFDLSATTVPGYNPLRENGLRLDLQAQWVAEGVKSAWGQATFDQTPQLARMLYLCLYVSRAMTISLVEGLDVLRPSPTLRERALMRIRDPFVHGALLAFDKLNDRRKEEVSASTLARLEAFCRDEIVRAVICSPHSLDLETVLTERRILLINFAKYQPLLPDPLKLLARMFTSDLLAHVYKGHGEGKFNEYNPVYFMVDEVQNMATRQLCDALDEGRGIGLHCTIAHQHISQLADEDQSGYLLHSVINDCRTKAIFGDLAFEDLEALAKNVMLDRYDPWRLKDEIKSPVFAPKETTRVSYGRSRSGSRGKSVAISQSESEGTSEAETTGESFGESTTLSETTGTVHMTTQGRSHSRGSSDTTSRGGAHTSSKGGAHTEQSSISSMSGHGTAHGTSGAYGSSEATAGSEGVSYAYDPMQANIIPQQMVTSENAMTGETASDMHGTSDSASEFNASGFNSSTSDTESWSDADTESWSDTYGTSESDTESTSMSEGVTRSTGISHGTSHERSRSSTHGTNHSTAQGITAGASEEKGWSESETLSAFHEYHREEITSSRTYLTPEEQTLLAIQKMKELPQATFTLKVPNHPAMFVRAPWVDEPTITKKTLEAGLQRVYALPCYTHLEQHQSPVIDVEARILLAPESKALPHDSPVLDDEPMFWQTETIKRPGSRQEKS